MEGKRIVKKGLNVEDSRRRREQNITSVRKDKKEEGLSKRRNLAGISDIVDTTTAAQVQATVLKDASDIMSLVRKLSSIDQVEQLDALRRFRRLLSTEKNPPVQECIECGAIPIIIDFLKRHDSPDLQFESAWALTNIASSTFTSIVVTHGGIPFLTALLNSPNADVREQCAWCLGNIAGDGPELRNIVLGCNALEPLLNNIMHPANLSLLRNCTWSLSNFCRGKPQADFNALAPAYQVLATLIQQNADVETITDATWALSYLSDGDDSRISAVVSLNVIPMLVQMLSSSRVNSIIPALRTLGNIVSGNDSHTQAVVDGGVLNVVCPLLCHGKKSIRKESCWLLSNIAAGSPYQLSQLVNTPNLIPRILEQLSAGSEWDVRKEAAWVISNIATGGNAAQLVKLVEHGAVRHLSDLLAVAEVKIILLAMEALEAILKINSNYSSLIDEAEGVDKLENLQEHESEEVYTKAVSILESYFGAEEEPDSENVAPFGNGNSYSFGLGSGGDSKQASFEFNLANTQPPKFSGDLGLDF